jgi:hypothetical protein
MNTAADNIGKLLQVGTSRSAFAIADDLPPELLAALAPYSNAAPEQRLWLAVAVLDLWNRAGHTPASAANASVAPSAGEDLSPCPPRAEAVLALLLQGMHPGLYAQWLELLAGREAHLPARYLPNMLDLGTRQSALRGTIMRVLGKRGSWLASLNADWSWAMTPGGYAADDKAAAARRLEAWQTGTLDQRRAALSAWRATEPQAALQALAASWSSETPEQRAALLPCLQVGLGLGDEAFLEQALDDRRKEVRQAAQELLGSLPGAALGQRMLTRLVPVLRLHRSMLGKRRFEITLPAERDKSMQRDGVGSGVHTRLGEKAGWLADMLAAVGPDHWLSEFGLAPEECLVLASESDFLAALLHGWVIALQRRLAGARLAGARRQQVAAPLLAWWYALGDFWLQADPGTRQLYPAGFLDCWHALPAAQADALLIRLIESSPPGKGLRDGALIDMLNGLTRETDRPWSATLSVLVVTRLLGMLPELSPYAWEFWNVLEKFARLADPAAMAAFQASWPGLDPGVPRGHDEFDKFFSAVRFRHEMYLSFQEPA